MVYVVRGQHVSKQYMSLNEMATSSIVVARVPLGLSLPFRKPFVGIPVLVQQYLPIGCPASSLWRKADRSF